MCNDAFPSEDQLTAHQVVKQGKPITEVDERREQLKEAKKEETRKRTKDANEKRPPEHQQPSVVTSA